MESSMQLSRCTTLSSRGSQSAPLTGPILVLSTRISSGRLPPIAKLHARSRFGIPQATGFREGPLPASAVIRGPKAQASAGGQSQAPPGLLTGLMEAIQAGLEQQARDAGPVAAAVEVKGLTYQPPGADAPLLRDVSLALPSGCMGLVYGRSGAGKTTLLQLLAGMAKPTSGILSVTTSQLIAQGNGSGLAAGMTPSQLAAVVGLVFQFPERHFLGATLIEELTFGWPTDPWQRQAASAQLGAVLEAVDLAHIPLRTPLRQLSDGYKRRVALAVQLARRPSVLLLDEPLAGLDWQARADVAGVLGRVKEQCTVLAVSHDLRELVPLVDLAWCMEPGGLLQPSTWPPAERDAVLQALELPETS